MKKLIKIIIYLLILLILSACEKKSKTEKITENEKIVSSGQENADFISPLLDAPDFVPDAPKPEPVAKKPKSSASSEKVDYDLSKMNYNMISALTFDMAMNSDKYLGKKIKIQGLFFSLLNEDVNQRFYACLVYDATACCQVGLDFVLNGEKKYPEDFPAERTEIEITGIYETRKAGNIEYNCLVCDQIKIL
ncbi:MAG: hypothetical protein IJP61_01605 [Treponema sp.]|nr:hypothetical protein [Treponema sp.]